MNNPEEEKVLEVAEAEKHEGHDIEFEDTIDIDKIQQTLQKHLEEDELKTEEEVSENLEEETVLESDEDTSGLVEQESISADEISQRLERELPEILQNARQEIDPQAKKYVIYIDPDNIEFMDNLSLTERKEVVNTILREREKDVQQKKAIERRKSFIRHLLVASVTFVIGFPILFLIVNKSMEAAIENYRQAQKNFSTLYKEKGKIKPFESGAVESFKY